MKNKLGLLALMGMAMATAMPEGGGELILADDLKRGNRSKAEIDLDEPVVPKCPNGAKEYFFNAEGNFSTEKMLRSEVVFVCYAINDKNAIRKFKKQITPCTSSIQK